MSNPTPNAAPKSWYFCDAQLLRYCRVILLCMFATELLPLVDPYLIGNDEAISRNLGILSVAAAGLAALGVYQAFKSSEISRMPLLIIAVLFARQLVLHSTLIREHMAHSTVFASFLFLLVGAYYVSVLIVICILALKRAQSFFGGRLR
jgi:hypothetical protein